MFTFNRQNQPNTLSCMLKYSLFKNCTWTEHKGFYFIFITCSSEKVLLSKGSQNKRKPTCYRTGSTWTLLTPCTLSLFIADMWWRIEVCGAQMPPKGSRQNCSYPVLSTLEQHFRWGDFFVCLFVLLFALDCIKFGMLSDFCV